MPIAVVGVSHHTAPVEVRERMAFGASEASRVLLDLRTRLGVQEAVLLSTCNRTEIYLSPVQPGADLGAVEEILGRRLGPLEVRLPEILFRYEGDRVVRHLYSVVSGLDSMVTGEAEIQGQVREAYDRSRSLEVSPPLTGTVMNRLFQTALSVGGQVRHETGINEGTASVASVAVELARKIFGQLRGKKVLILGAGATAELMVQALAREGVKGILVANRTYDRALALAERLDGSAVRMDRIQEGLLEADIVLASTAAPHHVLTLDRFRAAFPRGREHPLLVIDIAIPRDVDPAVGEERGVYLYNVDDLRRIIDDHVHERHRELPKARGIIRVRAAEFRSWYASLAVVPVIRQMREQAEEHRAAELERLMGGLEGLDAEARGRVEEFSRRLLNKLLHDPTVRLRRGMSDAGAEGLVDAVRFLYGLEDQPENPSAADGVAADVPAEPDPGADVRRPRDDAARRADDLRNPQHGAVE